MTETVKTNRPMRTCNKNKENVLHSDSKTPLQVKVTEQMPTPHSIAYHLQSFLYPNFFHVRNPFQTNYNILPFLVWKSN